jgi:hypothetical protein
LPCAFTNKFRNDGDILAANITAPLVAMLQSAVASTRLAALKALPGLVNRGGPMLRLQVGTRETVEVLWGLLLSTRETTAPRAEDVAAAEAADEVRALDVSALFSLLLFFLCGALCRGASPGQTPGGDLDLTLHVVPTPSKLWCTGMRRHVGQECARGTEASVVI